MLRPNVEPVAIAILAKAPVAGLAKSRLIPALGAHGAAVLQERLTEHTVGKAIAAAAGAVTLWCAPDCGHRCFAELAAQGPVALQRQPDGDLGHRMLAAVAAADGPVLVIGTDCPALTAMHLRQAAQALRDGADVVVAPAEDGGYVLIGMRQPHAALFEALTWSTPQVMAQTRRRIAALGLRATELPPLWDVDEPADLERMERLFPALAL